MEKFKKVIKQLDNFYVGFLSGMILMALTAAIVMNLNGTFQKDIDKTSVKNGDGGPVTQKDIENKIQTLEDYIDVYYLNEVEKSQLANGIYKGLVDSLGDVYSTYYTADEYAEMTEKSDGEYCGIGAVMSQSASTGAVTIIQVYEDSPAMKGGMLPGDVLCGVEGTEIAGMDLSSIVAMVKGEEGTRVSVDVIHMGDKEESTLVMERAKIEVPTVAHEMLKDDIGYIQVSSFDKVTVNQFKEAVDDLESQGEKGLIIDLRDNGGGLLTSVIDMLDYMLPEGLLMYTETKYGRDAEYSSTNDEYFDKPVVVLINGNTASASEVFTGAIQDYHMGTVVGTTSFGKGIVQSVMPLKDGSAIKLTTSKYFTPNGRNIHGTGLEPDVTVELDDEVKNKIVITKKEDNQLQAAIEEMKKLTGK